MVDDGRLAVVTVRELSRDAREVLDRVLRGERLIVARHGRPIATLQPLDGIVVQPLSGHDCDVTGSPLGDRETELAKLSELQRQLLRDGGEFDRIYPMRIARENDLSDVLRALEGLGVRGLARKTSRGWVVSGRGMILREILLSAAGRSEEATWRIRRRGGEPGRP